MGRHRGGPLIARIRRVVLGVNSRYIPSRASAGPMYGGVLAREAIHPCSREGAPHILSGEHRH